MKSSCIDFGTVVSQNGVVRTVHNYTEDMMKALIITMHTPEKQRYMI